MLKNTKMKCVISMDKKFNEKLKKIAASENRSLSNLIGTVLMDYVKSKGDSK